MIEFIAAHHLQNYVYLIIFFGMFVDAAVTVFTAIFLITGGAIAAAPGLAVLLLGIFAEQLFFYWLGLKLASWRRVVLWADKLAKPFDGHILNRTFHTLLLSKFIYGLHRAVLVRSGMLKVPLKKFALYAVYCSFVWLAVVGSLGAAFSASYQELKDYIRYAELVPLVLVVIFFFVQWRFSKRLRKEL